MKTFLRCAGSCCIVISALGCHSSSSSAKTGSSPQPASPQPVIPVAEASPVVPPIAPAKKLVCKGKTNDGVPDADFAETSQIYTLMDSKLGGWASCVNQAQQHGAGQTTVTFTGGAKLTLNFYPASDAAAQEAVLPAGSAITREDAIKALKDLVTDGCGVDYSQLAAGGPNATGDYKASGTTCTVDIELKMVKGSVVKFGVSQAS